MLDISYFIRFSKFVNSNKIMEKASKLPDYNIFILKVYCLLLQSLHQIEEQKWEHMVHEWNQEKIKLMNAMIGPSQNWLDLKRGPEVSSYVDNTKRTGHSMLDNQEMAYAQVVHQHNKNVLQGAMKPLLTQKFSQVADNFNDPKVKEMWAIIKEMSNIPPLVKNEDPLKSRATPQVQRALIMHAQNYLQQM